MDKIWIDVWKQRKLNEVCKINGRIGFRGYTQKDIVSQEQGGVLTFSPTNIVDNTLTMKCRNTYITKEKYEESPEIKIKNGDILFVKTGSTLGKSALVMGLHENATINPQIVVLRTQEEAKFLSVILISDSLLKKVAAVKIGGAVPTITEAELKNFTFYEPEDFAERVKIGNCFTYFDSIITFHHRKLNIINKICRYAWEQRKLSDIYGSIGNAFVGTATPYYAEQGHFYLESNNVKDGQINHNSEVFINDEFYEKQKDKWLHTGDMVMVQSGHVGHAAVISEELDNTAAHALIMFRNPKEEIEPYFLNYEYQTDKAKKKIENITTGNTIKHILASDMQEFVVDVPKYEEQKVIADYFRNLDHIITLHQRKCDEAKKLKKCMLQKMFPKDGEKVPEIRFSGFTSDWKQRKLEEIVNRITRKNSKLISELPLTISAQQGLIDQNEFFDKRVASKDVSGYYLIKNGEFAYNKSTSNDAPWGAIKRLDRYENGVLSTLYIVFEIKDETLVNSDFLVAYYSTNLWHKGIHEIAAEGARNHGLLNIAPTDFFKTKLKLPADIEEQKEIGEYFKKIDLLITFHQQKCDELKNIKRFMLQNIFVSEK